MNSPEFTDRPTAEHLSDFLGVLALEREALLPQVEEVACPKAVLDRFRAIEAILGVEDSRDELQQRIEDALDAGLDLFDAGIL